MTKRRNRMAVVCGLSVLLLTQTVAAESKTGSTSDLLTFSVGQFDTSLLSGRNRHDAVDLRVDYRLGLSLIPAVAPVLRVSPWLGVEGNGDRGFWGGGGLAFDVSLGPSFYLTPTVGVGAYGRGRSKDLGSTVEFRSSLETGYRFENEVRAGVYLSHMSNAGLATHNPGVNTIGASLSVPVGRLFGAP